jgi:pyrroloquinoline quinone (PQQ) biosynthesis protein C
MSTTIWERIEAARQRWDVLQHPFYARWSAGELSAEELADYSGQYRHATAAIAELSADVAAEAPEGDRFELRRHAEEEAAHVGLWDGFVNAVDGSSSAAPNAETATCVETWTRDDGYLPRLVRLDAIESSQPAISRTKLEGLHAHYGVDEGPGDAYFRVHQEADHEHAAGDRRLIEEALGGADEDELVAAAESAYRANWTLLDGVSPG